MDSSMNNAIELNSRKQQLKTEYERLQRENPGGQSPKGKSRLSEGRNKLVCILPSMSDHCFPRFATATVGS